MTDIRKSGEGKSSRSNFSATGLCLVLDMRFRNLLVDVDLLVEGVRSSSNLVRCQAIVAVFLDAGCW